MFLPGLNVRFSQVLSHSAEAGNPETVAFLLSSGSTNPVSIDNLGNSPLYYAAKGGRNGILPLLLDWSEGPDSKRNITLEFGRVFQQLWSTFPSASVRLQEMLDLFDRLVDATAMAFYDLGPAKFKGSEHVVLYFEWEIPRVVEGFLGRGDVPVKSIRDTLAGYITVTGSRDAFECMTCYEYVVKTWGDSGNLAFDVLCKAVKAALDDRLEDTSCSVGLIVRRAGVVMEFIRPGDSFLDVVQAVKWVCSAVRQNVGVCEGGQPSAELSISRVSQRVFTSPLDSSPSLAVFALGRLDKLPIANETLASMCWTNLFHSVVVAWTRIDRNWGAGLELSFDLMVRLATVENYHRFLDGTILLGFFTALIPMRQSSENHSVQWHLESVEESDGDCLLPRKLAEKIDYEWYKTKDEKILRESRCFVGWSERAHILLGTRELVEPEFPAGRGSSRNSYLLRTPLLGWSRDLKVRTKSLEHVGSEAGGQLGFSLGPISLTVKAAHAYQFSRHTIRREPSSQYQDALRCSRKRAALLVDSGAKRAWLAPLLSLVLHLCHRYYQEVGPVDVDDPIPFAIPSSDGDQAVVDAIGSKGTLEVITGTNEQDSLTLGQLFHRILVNLNGLPLTRRSHDGSRIFTSELMNAVTHRDDVAKEVPISEASGSWPDLLPFAEVADAVGVCSDVGQAIVPVPGDESSWCHECCYDLPPNKYYLAAHMRSLDNLCPSVSSRVADIQFGQFKITQEIFWETSSSPWLKQAPKYHLPIWGNYSLMQKILQCTVKSWESRGRLGNAIMGMVAEDGVVVFGRAGR